MTYNYLWWKKNQLNIYDLQYICICAIRNTRSQYIY